MVTKKKSNHDNRENGARVPIQLLVDYKADGSYLFDFCRDLGSGGVFIETEKPLPSGTELELTFTIPDSKETINTVGRVIWAQEKVEERPEVSAGMGIQFISFASNDRTLLDEFVKRYTKVQQSA